MRTTELLAGFVLAAFSVQASAAVVVDQNSPTSPVFMAGFGQPDLAQSFQQSAANVAGAGIFLQPLIGSGARDTLTISLWDKLPNAGGTLLASGSVTIDQPGVWVDVFWAPVAVTPDTTYYLVFDTIGTAFGIAGDTANPYSRGQVYANSGFGSFPTYDYTFRTYAGDSAGVIPEPATWAMMIAGFGLVGGVARRRRPVSA